MVTLPELLNQAETAAVWATVGGVIARILLRHPLRRLEVILITHAIRQAEAAGGIEDKLDTQTDGGLADLVKAIAAGPSPVKPPER